MRAIEFVGPRKIVLRDDVPVPAPKDGEVLVQCSYVALCGTNMGPYLYDGRWANPSIARPPGWLGHENIGTIVESRAAGWEPGTLGAGPSRRLQRFRRVHPLEARRAGSLAGRIRPTWARWSWPSRWPRCCARWCAPARSSTSGVPWWGKGRWA